MFKKRQLLTCVLILALFSFTGCSDSEYELYAIAHNADEEDASSTENIITKSIPSNFEETTSELIEMVDEPVIELVSAVVETVVGVVETVVESFIDAVDSSISGKIKNVEDNTIDSDIVDEKEEFELIVEVLEEEPVEEEYIEVEVAEEPKPIVPAVQFNGESMVAKTSSVDDSYFEDALFIGDSILKGFKSYVSPYPSNVIADQGAGLNHIYLEKDIYYVTPAEATTLWKGVEQVLPNAEKIYVLIGANGVPGLSNTKSMSYYEDLIIKLKERFPGKTIYACGLTPITSELSEKRAPDFTTEKLNDFNNQLYSMCQTYGIYFLQTDEWLKDSDGYLLPNYDGGDGLHLNKAGHTVLLDYFKTHTVSN